MPRKPREKPIEPLDTSEVHSLIGACSNRAPTGLRNRALIALMAGGGLRIAEALSVEPRDIGDGQVNVRRGKNGKQRRVGITADLMPHIDRWADRREQLGLPRRAPFICTLKGEDVEQAYVRQLLRRLGPKAGIEKRMHPHGLRHSHAYRLASEGTPLHLIRRQLGHERLDTTSLYIDHMAAHDVVDAINKIGAS